MEAAAATAFEAVYDYVLRIVRDTPLANDVVRATFNGASASDTGWLFATARKNALDALRHRPHRNGVEREALDFTRVDNDRLPNASVVFDKELVELVWDAAAALSPEDYSLLVLHVRHGLSAEDLGKQLGANGAVSRRLVHAREALDERVTSELLVRRARHNCPELEILVGNGGGAHVAEHIRRCARCHEGRARFVSPVGVLRAFTLLTPPRGLQGEIFATRRRRRRFGIL
jgi:DNA-directed RNA polymerase specialized sigma24 family protein